MKKELQLLIDGCVCANTFKSAESLTFLLVLVSNLIYKERYIEKQELSISLKDFT